MTNQKSSLKFDRALRFVHEACVDRRVFLVGTVHHPHPNGPEMLIT